MEIVGLGSYAMDVMIQVNEFPKEDGFVVVTGTTYVPGGSGTNVIVQSARLGADTGFLAKIGDDSLGKDIIASMKSEGLDTSALVIKEGGTSLSTTIVVDPVGKKFIMLNIGDSFVDYSISDVNLEFIKSAKVFYTDLFPGQTAIDALKEAKRCGLTTAVNMQSAMGTMGGFGFTNETVLDTLQYCDFFGPCALGALDLTGTDDPDAQHDFFRKYFRGTLLLTRGTGGSIAWDENDNRYEVPIFNVKAIDTTGAGDAYMGAMLKYYLLDKKPLQEAMRYATACSAICCTKLGARSGPSEPELLEFLSKN